MECVPASFGPIHTAVWETSVGYTGLTFDYDTYHEVLVPGQTLNPAYGRVLASSNGWAKIGTNKAMTESLPFYAISAPIPMSAVPEPGSNRALLALGTGGLTLRRRLKTKAAQGTLAGKQPRTAKMKTIQTKIDRSGTKLLPGAMALAAATATAQATTVQITLEGNKMSTASGNQLNADLTGDGTVDVHLGSFHSTANGGVSMQLNAGYSAVQAGFGVDYLARALFARGGNRGVQP